MSVDAISSVLVARRLPARALRARIALSPRLCLVAAAVVSFVARLLVSFAHETARYFPDEYIYSALARSIADSGTLRIRGVQAHFPALLEPLLAAPFWLTHDPELAYRLTLGMNALAMSLAAFPVYWLARRLSFGPWTAVACGAFAVAIPDLVYVNYVTADAVAYPLVLGAVAAAVAAVERPTARAQLAFVTFSGLATFARVQYVVLPAIFVLAAVAAERGHVLRALRRYRVALGLFALPAAAVVAAGPGHVLGYYRGIFGLTADPLALGHWAAVDSMLLAYAGGVVLVPGAVLGVVAAIGRPRGRGEGGFGWIAVGLTLALLAEAALYAANANGSERFQERYLFALLPLLPIGFVLSLGRTRLRIPVAALAAGLLLLALRVPLSGYTTGSGKQDSPLLQAVYQLELFLTSYGTGGLLVVSAVASLALLAGVTAFRPRLGLVALVAAITVTLLATAGALSYDLDASGRASLTYLPHDYRFVDHAHEGAVSALVPEGTPRPLVSEHLFWNSSLRRVLLLPDADAPDIFGSESVRIARDGTIMRGRHAVRGPLLVEEYANSFELSGAKLVSKQLSSSLWRPTGVPRVALLASNRYLDGWLGSEAAVTVWPDSTGMTKGLLHLRLWLPADSGSTPVRLRAPGLNRHVVVAPGKPVRLAVRARAHGPWKLTIEAQRIHFLPDGRDVSVRTDVPTFVRAAKASRVSGR